jgi:uncharacterized membrane protein YkvI
MLSFFRRYLLPGFVFQSIIIAGGYGTGRELVEFFLQYGPVSGLLGMLLPAMLLMSLACMIAFELARVTRIYEYRGFLKLLLGRAWFLYEIGFLTTVLLVLAVIGAAAGTLLIETFGIPPSFGTVGLLAIIAFLAFKGKAVIEGFLSIWSFILYGVYVTVFVMSLIKFGPAISDILSSSSPSGDWIVSGFRYGALQLSLVPAMLFATSHITRRKEALIAGALTGPIVMIPGILFFVAMLGQYPAILEQPIPANYLLKMLESPVLLITFQVVLVGTFVETGAGMIHAINERISGAFVAIGKDMPNYVRPLTAVVMLIGAVLLARFGLIDLIAIGYGAMTWVFIAVLIVPLATVGLWKITRPRSPIVESSR